MKITWKPVTGPPYTKARLYEARLEAALVSWEGTPYMRGQQLRGVGVDCVRFVAAVMDEVLGRPRTPIETLPDDAALHDRVGAICGMKRLRKLFWPNKPIPLDAPLEPGDIVVTGPENGGPGHGMIVGARPNTIWHSSGTSVHWTGLRPPKGHKVFRVYRMDDEERVA